MTEKNNTTAQTHPQENGTYVGLVANRPDGYAKKSTDCGDTIEYFVRLKGNMVDDVEFQIKGCVYTLASAKAGAALARKKTIAQARQDTTAQNIDDTLGGLPEHNKHCTELASEVMDEALREAIVNSRDPWRKLYNKRHWS